MERCADDCSRSNHRAELVGRAISESLYMHAARRGSKNTYETLADGRMVSVHSGSLLAPFDKDDWAELVVCLEMVSYPRPPFPPSSTTPLPPPSPSPLPPHTHCG